jgi:hypothetical protein
MFYGICSKESDPWISTRFIYGGQISVKNSDKKDSRSQSRLINSISLFKHTTTQDLPKTIPKAS